MRYFFQHGMGVWMGLIFFSGLHAQQHDFVYIQSENRLPFRASWDAAVYHSDSSGYLVIPQLPPGTNQIRILASRETVEMVFNIYMEQAPRGFTLRQRADNSWSLFDMVSYREIQGEVQLAKTADRNAYVSPLDPMPETGITGHVEKPVRNKAYKEPESIKLLFEKAGTDGIDQVYLLQQGDKTDTIALFIPALPERVTNSKTGQTGSKSRYPVQTEKPALTALLPKKS